ncbi:MAG: hypothetical protein KDA22_05235 [Phycisphaerales bacterium]|nr:hypothetical protein [Phycisphaerales bacterium]
MIADLISAMGTVLLAWSLAIATLGGIGLLVRRCWAGGGNISTDPLLLSFWVGLCATIVVAQVWHVFWPTDGRLVVVLAAVGAVGLAIHARGLWSWAKATLPARPVALVVLVLLSLWLADRAIGPCQNVDSAGYHLAAIRWTVDGPLAPGLANLSPRLGLNYSTFLYFGLLEAAFPERSANLGNGLLVLAFFVSCVAAGGRLYRGVARPSDLFMLAVPTPMVGVVVSSNIASPSTDLLPMLLCFMAVATALDGWRPVAAAPEALEGSARPRLDGGTVLPAVLLLCVAATCKPTVMPLAGMLCATLALAWLAGARNRPERIRALVALVALPCCVLAPWLVRNVMLSGYPLFPLTVAPVPVPWRVSSETAEHLTTWARADAFRTLKGTARLSDMSWVRSWIAWQFRSISFGMTVLPLALAVVSGATIALLRGRGTRRPVGLVLLPAIVASIPVWMMSGPMPRYGSTIFWTLAGVCCALATAMVLERWRRPWTRRSLLLCFVALSASPLVGWIMLVAVLKKTSGDRGIVFTMPGEANGFHAMPAPELLPFGARNGLVLSVPGPGRGYLWYAPRGATDAPSHRLALRRAGELDSGFVMAPAATEPPSDDTIARAAAFIAVHAEPGDGLFLAEAWNDRLAAELLPRLPAGMVRIDPGPRSMSAHARLDLLKRLSGGPGVDGGEPVPARIWFVFADGPQTGSGADAMPLWYELLDAFAGRGEQLHLPGLSVGLHVM